MHQLTTMATMAALLLAAACGGDEDDQKARSGSGADPAAAAPATPEEGPSGAPVAPEARKPPPLPTAGPPPTPTLDCAALLTPADVEEVCGAAMTMETSQFETGTQLTTCVRTFRPTGQPVRPDGVVQFTAGVVGSPQAFDMLEPEPTDAKDFQRLAVGDRGWSYTDSGAVDKYAAPTVRVFQGTAMIGLAAPAYAGSARKAACTREQLAELAKRAHGRLP